MMDEMETLYAAAFCECSQFYVISFPLCTHTPSWQREEIRKGRERDCAEATPPKTITLARSDPGSLLVLLFLPLLTALFMVSAQSSIMPCKNSCLLSPWAFRQCSNLKSKRRYHTGTFFYFSMVYFRYPYSSLFWLDSIFSYGQTLGSTMLLFLVCIKLSCSPYVNIPG